MCGDFREFQSERSFAYIIAIQIFQHGTATEAEMYCRKSMSQLQNGGPLFVRVNSVSTQI
jgi:cyclopropane fatty-acyl-phospholipid synthase-like methyltransferase